MNSQLQTIYTSSWVKMAYFIGFTACVSKPFKVFLVGPQQVVKTPYHPFYPLQKPTPGILFTEGGVMSTGKWSTQSKAWGIVLRADGTRVVAALPQTIPLGHQAAPLMGLCLWWHSPLFVDLLRRIHETKCLSKNRTLNYFSQQGAASLAYRPRDLILAANLSMLRN